MTAEERAAIEAVTDRPLRFRTLAGGLQELQARPCPLLDGTDCTVYAVRPYNCRRFACFRPSPTVPLVLMHGGACVNWQAAMTDRTKRREYARMQSEAQGWARDHGWRDEARIDG